MAFLQDEPAAPVVQRLLVQARQGKHRLLLSVINWGEIYYSIMRLTSQQVAEEKTVQIGALPITLVAVSEDLELARQAAIYKAGFRMSYADCFAAALAWRSNAELVTGDPEFHEVESEIRIQWLKSSH